MKAAKNSKPFPINRRRHVRFKPDPGTVANIDFKDGAEFTPQLTALVVNQSYKGVALVTLADDALKVKVGDIVLIQVGDLAPLKAKVVWKAELDPEVVKLGISFLE